MIEYHYPCLVLLTMTHSLSAWANLSDCAGESKLWNVEWGKNGSLNTAGIEGTE